MHPQFTRHNAGIHGCYKEICIHLFYFKGYEDWLRHKADREVNNRPTKVIRQGRVQDIPSKNVKVRYMFILHPRLYFLKYHT